MIYLTFFVGIVLMGAIGCGIYLVFAKPDKDGLARPFGVALLVIVILESVLFGFYLKESAKIRNWEQERARQSQANQTNLISIMEKEKAMAKISRYKYVCVDCGWEGFFFQHEMKRSCKPRCGGCGGTFLEPSSSSKVPELEKDQGLAVKEQKKRRRST